MWLCIQAINKYSTYTNNQPNNVIISGLPGTGKSYLMQMAATYDISKGLTVAITALLSNRAVALGGIHIYLIFKIPVSTNKVSVQRMTELEIIKLHKNPKQLCYLQSIDVMCCDESGQISS